MRLRGYDYSQPGWYFVTICTKNRQEIFGVVENGKMRLNVFGEAVMKCWFDLPNHYCCELDAFVIMPNHIHGIVVIPESLPPSHTAPGGLNPRVRGWENNVHVYPLTEIVRGLKTFSAAAINRINGTPGVRLWQTSFHEHILRGNNDILSVREYIRLNPHKWNEDRNNLRGNDINMVH